MSAIIDSLGNFAIDIFLETRERFREDLDELVIEKTSEEVARANEKVDYVFERMRDEGIIKTTAALHEACVDEETIIKLLQKFWQLYEEEAIEALRSEKVIWKPYRDVQSYLTKEGYDRKAVTKFLSKNNLYRKLKNDPTLWKKSLDELVEIVKEG